MNERHIKWAKSHDWYVNSNSRTGTVIVRQEQTDRSGKLEVTLRRFSDFPSLYRWAGY